MPNSTFFYPALDIAVLRGIDVVRRLSAEHPSYWLESPYDAEVEKFIREWFEKPAAPPPAPTLPQLQEMPDEGTTPWDFLYRESRELYQGLKGAKPAIGEPAEKMAFYRTATALMEKLIGLQERAHNLKQISEFHNTVMDIMENVLGPTQRGEVMSRLEAIAKGE